MQTEVPDEEGQLASLGELKVVDCTEILRQQAIGIGLGHGCLILENPCCMQAHEKEDDPEQPEQAPANGTFHRLKSLTYDSGKLSMKKSASAPLICWAEALSSQTETILRLGVELDLDLLKSHFQTFNGLVLFFKAIMELCDVDVSLLQLIQYAPGHPG